jgi:hypothetical protein
MLRNEYTVPTRCRYRGERILSHGVDDDGNVVMRVRLFGFGSDEDSWELTTHLPKLLVERYVR